MLESEGFFYEGRKGFCEGRYDGNRRRGRYDSGWPHYDEEQKASRMPDFRHTLYWNPNLNQESGSIDFYTSDMKGTYIATLKGWTIKGGSWEEKVQFIVK